MVQVIKKRWFVVTRKTGNEILVSAVPPLWGNRQIETHPLLFVCNRRAEICRRLVDGDLVEIEPHEKYQPRLF